MTPTDAITKAYSPTMLPGRLRTACVKRLLPVLFLILPVVAQAQSDYIYSIDAGKVTIDQYTGAGGAVAIPALIEEQPVTRIGGGAFAWCNGLTGVTLPTSLVSIGEHAFEFCSSLGDISIPSNVVDIQAYAFYSCARLTNVTIGSGVAGIGERAFSECFSLSAITVDPMNSVFSSLDGVLFNTNQTHLIQYPGGKAGSYTIPPGVTSIGNDAFGRCTSLTDVTIPAGVTNIGRVAFGGCTNLAGIAVESLNAVFSSSVDGVLFNSNKTVLIQYPGGRGGSYAIPATVTNIGMGAFAGCPGLTGVTIPDSVIGLGDFAFVDCFGLTAVTIPDSITLIGNGVFSGCRSLTNAVIPDSVIGIGEGAFQGCEKLSRVTLPESVAGIGPGAFHACGSLASIAIPDSVASLGQGAFSDCTNLMDVTIGKGAVDIGYRAFFECGNLTSITVDEGNANYSSMDGVLFDKSTALLIQYPAGKAGRYTVSNSVTYIDAYAFNACAGLTSITIPASVSFIGAEAFLNCANLMGVYFRGNAPGLAWNVFNGADNATVFYLPRTTGWGQDFGDRPAMLVTVPVILPPKAIGKKSFTARWAWGEDGAPEGELSVVQSVDGFPQYVPGYESRYIGLGTECVVTNLTAGRDYSYRFRRLMPDGMATDWSSSMKVRTGKGMPVFKNLLSEVPVTKGISQEFALSALVAGGGALTVKSSNNNAIKAVLSSGVLTLHYLWKDTNTSAKVTLTLTHSATGYKVSYATLVKRAGGGVAILGNSALTNAGSVAAQEITLENRTGGTVYGIRIRALGLDQASWLVNQTGLDPLSHAAIREMPCVLPAGSQMVVRLVYAAAYKKQARTRPVAHKASAIMTPANGALPVKGEMAIERQLPYNGLWWLGAPANRNRLYTVFHSDDAGATWMLDTPMIRSTANYLMWLDTDEGAPANRLYRVVDTGV